MPHRPASACLGTRHGLLKLLRSLGCPLPLLPLFSRRLSMVFATLLLAATMAPATAQDFGFDARSGSFVLRSMGRCLEVNEAQLPLDGGRAQLQRCDGQANQTWRYERGHMINQANGRCLEVHAPDAGLDGARVQAQRCNGTAHQSWRLEQGQLKARVDDRCLDAHDLDRDRSLARVQTWTCSGEPNQRWRLAALPNPAGPFIVPAPSAPVVQRDVQAGPLFNQADAERKCPALCQPGPWSGRWVTTVPGRMSVCSCQSEEPGRGAAQAPPGSAAMSGERLSEVLRLLEDEAFPSQALRTLATVARDHRFSVDQLRRLFDVFAFASDRLRVMDLTLARVVDPANAYQLLSAFTFEMDKAQARTLIERLATR